MSEFDELENLFSDAFANEQVVPPKSVKQNIDSELFGSAGRLIWMFALVIIFLLPIGGVLFYDTIEHANGQIASTSVMEDNTLNIDQVLDQGKEKTIIDTKTEKEQVIDQVNKERSVIEGNSTNNGLIEKNQTGTQSNEKNTTYTELSGNAELNKTGSTEQNELYINAVESENLEGSINTTQSSKSAGSEENSAGSEENIEEVNSLLAITKVEVTEEKPLPYDLLLMCATPNYQPKQRMPITLDVYAGVEKGFNSYGYKNPTFAEMDKSLKEDLGTSVSLELSYPLNRRISLASGLGMSRSNNLFRSGNTSVDSTYLGDTMIVTWYFDTVNQVQTSDTTYTPMYEILEFEEIQSTFITRTSFFVPLYLKYEMPIGMNWSVGASAGVRFSYDHLKIGDNTLNMTVNEFKRFGISTVFRPQVNYSTGQWKIGAYGQTGFDLIHGLSGDATRVKRLSLGGGLNFRYTF